MKDLPPWPRAVGFLLIGTGLLGLLLSLTGLLLLFYGAAVAEQALDQRLSSLDQALAVTDEGLTLAGTTLSEVERTLGTLGATVGTATSAISSTQPTLTTIGDLAGSRLPQTVRSTQQALASARDSARLVDGVLGTLSIFGVRYEPEVPLNTAIGQIAESLDGLPDDLAELSSGVEAASTNLAAVTGDLAAVSTGLTAIADDVQTATTVVKRYQDTTTQLRREVAVIKAAAPRWFMLLRVLGALGLIWLGFAQLALLVQGRTLFRRVDAPPPKEIPGPVQ